MRPTIICEPGALVSVPFPHVERAVTVRRPALVIARRDTGAVGVLLWTVMVTSAERAPWIGDVPVSEGPTTGLRIASCVRTAKVATVAEANAKVIGVVDDPIWQAVMKAIRLPV